MPMTKDQRTARNKQWYADHPVAGKVLRGTVIVLLIFIIIGACAPGEDAKSDTEKEPQAPAAVVDVPEESDDADAEERAEEERKAEEAAAEEERRKAAAEVKRKAAEERAAARQARKEAARKEALRKERAEQRRARQEAAAQAERERQEAEANQVYYDNCTAVRAAGAAPIYAGDPGYGSHLDRDGDGVACE